MAVGTWAASKPAAALAFFSCLNEKENRKKCQVYFRHFISRLCWKFCRHYVIMMH